jgi:hypothetical protein
MFISILALSAARIEPFTFFLVKLNISFEMIILAKTIDRKTDNE